ncbi:MAG TPA: ATP-binding protein [Anaerolineales bacterium]|nr:ATP-binding protein [Pyrinomonadaceae bacterium]HLE29979.1 ATP-binding protein [Anaerolineales bacterium]
MNLEEFYESLSIQVIEDFLRDGKEEDLHLEFKTVSDNPFNKEDRKNFAKALSGFGNSAGGVVIWGIDARRNAEGIDSASEKRPIRPLAKFISDLNSSTGEFVDPIVDGVRHKSIPLTADAGFAASLIPESQSAPHMAKAGEDRYYKRSGDSFYRLEHFDLEEMFGRRPRPVLEFMAKPAREGGLRLTVILGLTNHGKGIAKFPYLSVEVEPPYRLSKYGLDGNRHTGLPRLVQHFYTGQKESFGGSSEIVVYPESELDVTAIRIGNIQTEFNKDAPIPDLKIQFSMCCEGIRMQRGEHILPGDIIKAAIFP